MYNFPIFVEDLLVHSEIKSNQINTNTMKIKHLFLSVLAMASVAVACNKNEDPSSDKPSLTLNPTELTFEIAGGTQTVAVEASGQLLMETKRTGLRQRRLPTIRLLSLWKPTQALTVLQSSLSAWSEQRRLSL